MLSRTITEQRWHINLGTLLLASVLAIASLRAGSIGLVSEFQNVMPTESTKPSYAEFERLVFTYDMDVATPRLRLQHWRDLGYEDRWLRIASNPVYDPNPDRTSQNWWFHTLLSGMNRTIGLTSAAGSFWVATLHPANAWVHGSATSPSICLQGAGANDNGCASANGTVAYNVLTDPTIGPGTPGFTVVRRPYFNVAGSLEDKYYVGVSAGTLLLDPATNTLPGPCSYSGTGNAGNPQVTCGVTAMTSGVLNGWEFGPTGGHGSTYLTSNGSNTKTSFTITNSDFEQDAGNTTYAFFQNTSGGYSSANFDIEHDTFNGTCQSTTCTLNTNWSITLDATGARTEKWDAFLFFPQRPQTFNTGPTATTPGDSYYGYNLVYGFSYVTGGTHGEFVEDISNPSPCCSLQGHTTYEGNTGILPNSAGTTGTGGYATTLWYISGGGGLQGYQHALLEKNVSFINKNSSTGVPIAAIVTDITAAYVYDFTAIDNYSYAPASAAFSCGGNQSFLTGDVTGGVLTASSVSGFVNGLLADKSLWLNATGTPSGDYITAQVTSATSVLGTLAGATSISGSKVISFTGLTGSINGKNTNPVPYPGDLAVGSGVLPGTHFQSAVIDATGSGCTISGTVINCASGITGTPVAGAQLSGTGVTLNSTWVSAIDATHWNISPSQTVSTPFTALSVHSWNVDVDNNIPSGVAISDYRSGSNGTYNTAGGVDFTSQLLTAYSAFPPTPGVPNDAVMPSVTMSGNIDMTNGSSQNSIVQNSAACPLPGT